MPLMAAKKKMSMQITCAGPSKVNTPSKDHAGPHKLSQKHKQTLFTFILLPWSLRSPFNAIKPLKL